MLLEKEESIQQKKGKKYINFTYIITNVGTRIQLPIISVLKDRTCQGQEVLQPVLSVTALPFALFPVH